MIHPLGLAAETKPDRTRRVTLLGQRAEILFQPSSDGLAVTLPDQRPTSFPAALRIGGHPVVLDSEFGQKTRRRAPQQDALITASFPSHARNGIVRDRNKLLAILINGRVVSAPRILSAISKGALIRGDFTAEEASGIVRGLRPAEEEARP